MTTECNGPRDCIGTEEGCDHCGLPDPPVAVPGPASAPADPVVSPADTREALASNIRLFLQRSMPIQCPAGTVRPPLDDLAALLAVGERDKAEIKDARYAAVYEGHVNTLVAENTLLEAQGERDRRKIARLTRCLERIAADDLAATESEDAMRAVEYRIAARAVLAGEEDAGDE